MAKVRMGIIGAGWWAAENHIPVLKSFPDVEVAAVCRIGRDELERVRKKFEVPFGTEDYRELLALEGLDGVVVSSPHDFHYRHSASALERGIHVLCEKPMTLHPAEAKHLAELAETKKLHFVIPYGWSFTDFAAEAKKRVENGELGKIQYALCHMSSALKDLFSGEGAWIAKDAFFQPQMDTWSDPAKGGGYAHGQITHALGLMLWISGLDPVEVFAFLAASKSGADMCDAITCRFSNGAAGIVGGVGLIPPGCPNQVDIRLFGTEGTLLLDIERPRLEVFRYDGKNCSFTMNHAPGEYTCTRPLRVFVDLIQGKDVRNPAPAAVGKKVVDIIDAAFRSAASKQMAAIEP